MINQFISISAFIVKRCYYIAFAGVLFQFTIHPPTIDVAECIILIIQVFIIHHTNIIHVLPCYYWCFIIIMFGQIANDGWWTVRC